MRGYAKRTRATHGLGTHRPTQPVSTRGNLPPPWAEPPASSQVHAPRITPGGVCGEGREAPRRPSVQFPPHPAPSSPEAWALLASSAGSSGSRGADCVEGGNIRVMTVTAAACRPRQGSNPALPRLDRSTELPWQLDSAITTARTKGEAAVTVVTVLAGPGGGPGLGIQVPNVKMSNRGSIERLCCIIFFLSLHR